MIYLVKSVKIVEGVIMADINEQTLKKYLNTSIEIFDEKKLQKTAGNSAYKIKTLVEGFEGSATRLVKDMERNLEKKDFDKIKTNCNDLILISGDVGGNRLLLAVDNIKKSTVAKDSSTIANLIIIIYAEIEKLGGELREFLEASS